MKHKLKPPHLPINSSLDKEEDLILCLELIAEEAILSKIDLKQFLLLAEQAYLNIKKTS